MLRSKCTHCLPCGSLICFPPLYACGQASSPPPSTLPAFSYVVPLLRCDSSGRPLPRPAVLPPLHSHLCVFFAPSIPPSRTSLTRASRRRFIAKRRLLRIVFVLSWVLSPMLRGPLEVLPFKLRLLFFPFMMFSVSSYTKVNFFPNLGSVVTPRFCTFTISSI